MQIFSEFLMLMTTTLKSNAVISHLAEAGVQFADLLFFECTLRKRGARERGAGDFVFACVIFQ